MKVFISSLIGGFESYREAARSAVRTLRHEPVMAEDFGALPHSPQIACLKGLRAADLVILVLGNRYGYIQGTSGVSPTHEEYLDARGKKPILVFVQESNEREDAQTTFLTEVQAWQAGHFRASFTTEEDLREQITRALHEYELANAAGAPDVTQLQLTANKLIPRANSQHNHGSPILNIAMVGGPLQRILRPVQLESPTLVSDLHQQALFGSSKLFNVSDSMESGIESGELVLQQPNGTRIQLNEQGSIFLRVPLASQKGSANQNLHSVFAIIEEHVQKAIESAIAYGAWVFDHIDDTHRLSHVAIAASLDASDFLGWRTQAEQDANPNSGTMRLGQSEDRLPVQVDRPRAALRFEAHDLAEDLLVPLRRMWK
ncbi:DUF4062 domain-containing protein [Pusillimonas caeni]|uniref:DUF4062 domain-containing protein n=1 Tax=Pusillimonas caeni TaxID=1348472 RepID=UPI000E59E606|nr:DUF4062 domain-containing protein [Pusillimonas caeni]TFL15301.1 DUF4062 domain-containing protein [Pusillimonas caeni]